MDWIDLAIYLDHTHSLIYTFSFLQDTGKFVFWDCLHLELPNTGKANFTCGILFHEFSQY